MTINFYMSDYYPYGKVLREYVNGDKERYLTTQHERDQETGLDYRGARYYDNEVGRFLSLDPHARDYPSLSDYCYVAGNPIIFIDPDGKDFVFTVKEKDKDGKTVKRNITFDGTSMKYEDGSDYVEGTHSEIDEFRSSYDYIVNNGADIDAVFSTLANDHDIKIKVKFTDRFGQTVFSTKDNEITWCSTCGLEVDFYSVQEGKKTLESTGVMSPAMTLFHEVVHAFIYHYYDERQKNSFKEKYNVEGVAPEEVHVVDDFESKAIDILQNKGFSEHKRNGFNYGWEGDFRTKGPTSTKKQ